MDQQRRLLIENLVISGGFVEFAERLVLFFWKHRSLLCLVICNTAFYRRLFLGSALTLKAKVGKALLGFRGSEVSLVHDLEKLKALTE